MWKDDKIDELWDDFKTQVQKQSEEKECYQIIEIEEECKIWKIK